MKIIRSKSFYNFSSNRKLEFGAAMTYHLFMPLRVFFPHTKQSDFFRKKERSTSSRIKPFTQRILYGTLNWEIDNVSFKECKLELKKFFISAAKFNSFQLLLVTIFDCFKFLLGNFRTNNILSGPHSKKLVIDPKQHLL